MNRIALAAPLLLIILCACGKTPAPEPVPSDPAPVFETDAPPEETPEPTMEYELTDLTYLDAFVISDRAKLYVSAAYPKTGVPEIDTYYDTALEEFSAYAAALAEELRGYDETGAVTVYELASGYELRQNSDALYSVHREIYIDAGGVHGSTAHLCDNFLKASGRRLELADFFSTADYEPRLLAAFDSYIGRYNDTLFFPNAKELLREQFPPRQFCVSDEGLEFYFAPYELGPYTSGTIIIPVTFDAIRDIFTIPET